MRVLVEIVHPADVLFFLRPIRAMRARGDAVTIASRHKDVTVPLLEGFGLDHEVVSRQGRGMAGLALELVRRDAALLRLARRTRPHVMLGFGGVAISHVGRLLGVPSLAVYDHDLAWMQTRLAWPFVSRLVVPEDYDGPTPAGRTVRWPGTKDLSYFHPASFMPSADRALEAGFNPARANVFVRLVRWGANHDFGKSGWSAHEAARLVATLAPRAALHVSAEAEVPEALRPYLWDGAAADVHHLVAHCDAYVGESCTMACEAVAMGVPALYAGVDLPGYVRGLSQRRLLAILPPSERGRLGEATVGLLEAKADFAMRRQAWLAASPDWAEALVAEADALVASAP